jgi:hypothetical protein
VFLANIKAINYDKNDVIAFLIKITVGYR